MDQRSDEVLMLAYAQADLAAFDILYRRHKGALYRYFVRQVSDRALAEDLYQECWSRIIKAALSYRPSAKWSTWAYRIAHNLVADHFRSLKGVEKVDVEESNSEGPDEATESHSDMANGAEQPADAHEQQQLALRLKHCIAKLPAVQREAFIFTQETDLTVPMIADVVDASFEAVKTRLRYARQSLQQCLRNFRHEGGQQ